jgi:hypothetical protein
MAAFAATNDIRRCAKALKMGAEATRADFFAVDSWEKELTAQTCALLPCDISLCNSDEVSPDRNKSCGLEPASRKVDRAMLEVNICVNKPGYLARSSASRVERKKCSAQRFVMNFVI